MFIFENVFRNITRNKGKSVIAFIVVVVLSAFLVIYSGFLGKQETELKELTENIDIDLKLCNISGTQTTGLIIDTNRLDKIEQSGYVTPVIYVTGALYFDENVSHVRLRSSQISVMGVASGVTNDSIFGEDEIEYLDGYDGSIFSGEDYLCVVSEDMMREENLKLGDEFTKTFYTKRENGASYYSGEHTFKVVGSFKSIESEKIPSGIGFITSFQTLRNMAEVQNYHTWPTSAEFKVNDPEDLNDLISLLEDIKMVECQRKTSSTAQWGNSCIITDGVYIRISEPLIKNIGMLNTLYYPIFVAVVLIAFLASYLLMQSRRGEIAINCSLGVSKGSIFLTMLLESAIICLVGSVISTVAVLLVFSQSISTAASVLVFIPFYLLGCALAVLTLLRTNVITILTSSE